MKFFSFDGVGAHGSLVVRIGLGGKGGGKKAQGQN